jgi:hypothetical protein
MHEAPLFAGQTEYETLPVVFSYVPAGHTLHAALSVAFL